MKRTPEQVEIYDTIYAVKQKVSFLTVPDMEGLDESAASGVLMILIEIEKQLAECLKQM